MGEGAMTLKCPAVKDCKGVALIEDDTVNLPGFDKALVEFGKKTRLKNLENSGVPCPTKDCAHIFNMTEELQKKDKVDCFLCKMSYCPRCRVEIHTGEKCEDFMSHSDKIF
jgi:hypothetical protein